MATLNPNLKDFWLTDKGKLRRARHRILYGGRASSKSWEFAGRIAQIAQEYRTRVLCVRRYQNKIKDSVYTLIKNQIDNFDFGGYNILASSIEHQNGSEFAFYGIERNVDEIKSFEGADILWIEEAHNLTKEQWQILEPTIRKEGSEIWISFNPNLVSDFVYQHFIINTPKNSIVRLVNYDENGFLSKTMLSSINEVKEKDFEWYQHIYLGQPLSDDDQVIIKRSWIESAIDAHVTLNLNAGGTAAIGYDVADSGADKNATVTANGIVCTEIDEWKAAENELNKSCKRVMSRAKENDALIIYDSIGVGAHVGSTLNEIGYKNHAKFNASGGVVKPDSKYAGKTTNKEAFKNIKAQAWQLIADRFRNTYNAVNNNQQYDSSELISISSECDNIERLIFELSTPRRDYADNGALKVESKKDLAKRDIASPNIADAFIMAFSQGLVKRGGGTIKFTRNY